jgi:hypothetical protein
VREKIRMQQPAGVNYGVPSLADAAGPGEAAGRETTEHIRQHVLRYHLLDQALVVLLHRPS